MVKYIYIYIYIFQNYDIVAVIGSSHCLLALDHTASWVRGYFCLESS